MTDFALPPLSAENQETLEDLRWELEAGTGEFSLILVRCNYTHLQHQLVTQLQTMADVHLLRLQPEETALYTQIQQALAQGPHPLAIVVVGLETIVNLDGLLVTANQVREEFRKQCPVPVVLWVTDSVYQAFVRSASDLESWATKTHVTLPPDQIVAALKATADRLFATYLTPKQGTVIPDAAPDLLQSSEVAAALREVGNQAMSVDPGLQASLDFAQGLNAIEAGDEETALACFESSLTYWQQAAPSPSLGEGTVGGEGELSISARDWAEPPLAPLDQDNREVALTQRALGESPMLREALLLFHIGMTRFKLAEQAAGNNWQVVYAPLRRATDLAERQQASWLGANYITWLERTLQKLTQWDELGQVAQQAVVLHQQYDNQTRLAQDYGFLARVALEQQGWLQARQYAQQGLDIVNAHQKDRRWLQQRLLMFLAQAERGLGNLPGAIAYLESATNLGDRGYPKAYIRALDELHSLYTEQHQYLAAFRLKRRRLSIEQQYGIRAFIGAGRLRPQKHELEMEPLEGESPRLDEGSVSPEIAAAGRQQDLDRLLERLGRRDYRLIVVHGNSGVGKSSLVNAGLVPRLRQQIMDARSTLPIVLRTYTQWEQALSQQLAEYLPSQEIPPAPLKKGGADAPEVPLQKGDLGGSPALLTQLQQLDQRNLRLVLILDQFEEFFFRHQQPEQRRPLFQFIADSLQILSLNLVIVLREDYLHLLLELARLPAIKPLGIDILGEKVRYELGDFSPVDATAIIHSLTNRAHFFLEPALIERLVADLAAELGVVRPIELQIVGAQLQNQTITTLAGYRALGDNPKLTLVQNYVADVVQDCGAEHQTLAELVLFLLTDENGTRPLKTRAELEKELQALGGVLPSSPNPLLPDLEKGASTNPSPSPNLGEGDTGGEGKSLDLVLQIIVGSGLVLLLPDVPDQRYQLVHDYLAAFIRQQQAPRLSHLMAELEQERAQRRQVENQFQVTEQELTQAQQTLTQTQQRTRRQLKLGVVVLTLMGVAAVGIASFAGITISAAKQDADKRIQVADKESTQRIGMARKQANAQIKRADEKIAQADQQVAQATRQITAAEQRRKTAEVKVNAAEQRVKQSDQQVQAAQAKLTAIDQQSQQQIADAKAQLAIAEKAQQQVLAEKRQVDQDIKVGIRLERSGVEALEQFHAEQTVALLTALKAGKELRKLVKDERLLENYPATNPLLALQIILDGLRETRLEGHQGKVLSVVFSSDGSKLATGSQDGTARVWDIQGKQRLELKGHQGVVLSVVFSPDGSKLATSSEDGTTRIWDIRGKQLAILTGHEGSVSTVVFSPDGSKLATSGEDGTARIWDIRGKQLAILTGHEGSVSTVVFSPDGSKLATSGEDGTARIWDIRGKQLAILTGHEGSVSTVVFSPDGSKLATSSEDGTAKVWDTQGNQLAELIGHEGLVLNVVFSPDGSKLATSSSDRTARIWDTQGNQLAELADHQGNVYSIVFSPDGNKLATRDEDNIARVWNTQGALLDKLIGHQGLINNVVFSPDGSKLATSSSDGTARIWNSNGNPLAELNGHQRSIQNVVFSPVHEVSGADSKLATIGGWDGTARVWNIQGRQLAQLTGHQGNIQSVVFSSIHKASSFEINSELATSGFDGTARIWDTQGNPLAILTGHEGRVMSVVFSPDGSKLATSGLDGTVRVWNNRGKQLAILTGHQGTVSNVMFSPDGNKLVSIGEDGTARIWDTQGKQLAELTGHQGKILSVVFSPDSSKLATGGEDHAVRIWDTQGKQLAELTGHQENVLSVVFSPDGSKLATGDLEGTVRVWNTYQGNSLAILLTGQKKGVYEMAFSPDGSKLASTGKASTDKEDTVKIWNLAGRQIAQYEGRGVVSLDWQWIATINTPLGSNDDIVRLWRLDDLDGLLVRACKNLQWYLKQKSDLPENDKHICDDIPH